MLQVNNASWLEYHWHVFLLHVNFYRCLVFFNFLSSQDCTLEFTVLFHSCEFFISSSMDTVWISAITFHFIMLLIIYAWSLFLYIINQLTTLALSPIIFHISNGWSRGAYGITQNYDIITALVLNNVTKTSTVSYYIVLYLTIFQTLNPTQDI